MEEVMLRWIGQTAAIRTDILSVAGICLAVAVTVHVLLRKREVGAAIGWIGLAWLSPFLGGSLYILFGVNRVTRRARRLRVKPSSPGQGREGGQATAEVAATAVLAPLDRVVGTITQLPLSPGNAVTPLRHGDEAYPMMLAAIGAARRSVVLSSYIMRDDRIGRTFVAALAGAKARGVEVRVLIDGIGSGYLISGIHRRLRRAGVPVARFMHSALPWRMPFLNLRSHKKLMIVDGEIAFTGGINIADANCLSARPSDPMRDTHFRLVGPVVEQLAAAFASDWALADGEDLDGPVWFAPPSAGGPTSARVVTSGPDADLRKIELVVLQAVACARRSIRLATPYFLPSEVLSSALALAAGRGIAVDVIVPETSDHRLVDWATRAHVDPLLAAGVRIWLDTPPFDHSKILVVDEVWCFVGSANWDMRSFRLNFELNVEIYDADLARWLGAVMDEKTGALLTREDLARRSLPIRLRDASARLWLPYL
ncbi:phospholipase D-like domain-containing protein [Methylobacterium sp. Leaf108]|uniref:phospholipase D-like domain-containing protein n=1 Tax=Methylobacterium sp. Leaf108 TaxID=1736256 RepID=UPI0006F27DF3|nr:phospholipase D-like domain-containing protein [Methylobacterium sp. Leaf108]KQP55117.1 cardiolipin synthase [Methylobacterium sp. Leaf108]